MSILYGCQTYTWQMSYEKYASCLDHIIEVVVRAGFAGLEPEVCMLGKYNSNPAKLSILLEQKNLKLGALCLVCDWLSPEETPEEKAEADRIIKMLSSYFPETVLALCQMPQTDRSNLAERQTNCLSCCNSIGKRAGSAGIKTVFHPNSPPGSVFRTAEDYTMLLDGLNTDVVKFAPDAGHIAKGGMDPVTIIKKYASVIGHVHFKDMDNNGVWTEMGKGSIDFSGIVKVLEEAGYNGWIMVEDESPQAELEPDAVTLANGEYLRTSCSNF
jgi:inosose dehydratase